MEKFIELKDDEANQFALRLKRLLGTFKDEHSEQEYFEVFNHEVKNLNQRLTHPQGILDSYQRAYELQEQYNQALDVAKKRWEKANKEFGIGANLIKELSARKKMYEQSLQDSQAIERKYEKMESFFESRAKVDSPWYRLQDRANILDESNPQEPSRSRTLKKIRNKWQGMGVLAKCSAKDLLSLHKDLLNFSYFLQFISSSIPKNSQNKVDAKILALMSVNGRRVNRYQDRLLSAMAWKIQSAALNQNLRCDDSMLALTKLLMTQVFSQDERDDLYQIIDLVDIPKETISHEMEFNDFTQILQIMRQENYADGVNAWLDSPWIKNKDKKNIIALSVVESYSIPSKLIALTPNKFEFGVGEMLRYWFFRTQEKLSSFWHFLRNMIVGDYNETAVLINETHRQVESFDLFVQVYRRMGYAMNLNNINKSSGFLAALELPSIIDVEKTRASPFKPSWIAGVLLQWFPIFNRAKTYQFFTIWDKELECAKQAIVKKCANIAQFILEDFETLLMNSISHQSFLLPKDLMSNITLFISTYGKDSDLVKLKALTDPFNILQKFEFLRAPKEDDVVRHLNEDAVFSFVQFAQKYWTDEHCKAVKAVVDIITKESFPTKEDDQKLKNKLSCFFKGKDINQSFEKLMNLIAMKYIYPTGDDGNDNAFEFLCRFAPKAARNWRSKRQNVIEDKFVVLNAILCITPNHERNLSEDDLHLTSGAQLRYKNYARYIDDLKSHDATTGAKNVNVLIKQARKYVKEYQGDNIHYADLIMKLCLDTNPIIVQTYIQKRFGYLLENANLVAVHSSNLEEFQLFCNISKNSSLIRSMIDVVNEKYRGDDSECSEIILHLNDASLTAAYFSKRFEKLLLNADYENIIQHKELYNELIKNDKFAEALNKKLATYFETLVNNEDWSKFESIHFCHVVESFANIQNKETYRLLRTKRLLKKNDCESTKDYLGLVTPYLNEKLESAFITLDSAKKQMLEILTSHVNEISEQGRWEGHTQYFLEFFLPTAKKDLLFEIRYKWLEYFFNHPEKFADVSVLENTPLDAKFHFQNKDFPNDAMNLAQFYGKGKLPLLREFIMQNIDDFNDRLSDDHIKLIRNYLRDNAFTLDAQGPFFCKKFESYQKCKRVFHCIQHDIWFDSIQSIGSFSQEMNGLQALQEGAYNQEREQLIIYNQKLLDKMLVAFENKFKEMLVNENILGKIGSPSFDQKAKEYLLEKDKIFRLIQESDLPVMVKESIKRISVQNADCFGKITSFLTNCQFDKLHLISFAEEDLSLFQNISENTKIFISGKINLVKEYLSHRDPLFPALSSFTNLMNNQYQENGEKNRDLIKIRQFRARQRNYPGLANVLATKLIKSLNTHESLVTYSCFHGKYNTYQNVFLNYLSVDVQKKLMQSLLENISWLITIPDVNQFITQRKDWLYHGVLYQWLKLLPTFESSKLKHFVSTLVQHSLVDARKSLLSLIDRFDTKIEASVYNPKPEIVQNEQKLIKSALLIRSFGDDFQKKALDDLLSQIAKRQRRAMMKGFTGPFFEHCLDYADKLISVAGNTAQRVETARLIETWNRYRTVSLRQVREQAVDDALPQYINDFDKCIYQYFIKKYNLSNNFSELMHAKFEQWRLNDELIEPNQLLKKHPIQEFLQILEYESKGRGHGFFHTKPTEREAKKLIVAFCLHLQAHQLINIWNQRKKTNADILKKFTPEDISEPLSAMVKYLNKKFDIGRGDFNRSIANAISKNDDYFASWSMGNEQHQKLSQVTKRGKRVTSR